MGHSRECMFVFFVVNVYDLDSESEGQDIHMYYLSNPELTLQGRYLFLLPIPQLLRNKTKRLSSLSTVIQLVLGIKV